MARLFVGVVIFYFLILAFFALVNLSLVFLRARSLSLAVRNIIIFGLFPVLVFTKEGRKMLQKVINF